jgi:hypothetical protein
VIGKIPDKRRDGKSSFRDLVSYCTSKDSANVVHFGFQNVECLETAANEMEGMAKINTRCKDPVFHVILAWREMEIPTTSQVDEAVGIALKELDLQNCQAIWALQNDTQNRHVHIVVNRIDPDTGKAIQPANGWTYKALERAARKIELAQGWESENSGFYLVTEDGQLVEKGRREQPAISTSARDGEAHTAIKSAERIAQETAAPIIRESKSWNELHKHLAGQGISFEAKGSGAVLLIGEIVVKASKAGRDISMSKLVAHLGEYKPRPDGIVLTNKETEPVEKVSKSKVNSDWERFKTTRENYFKDKKEENTAIIERHKNEKAWLRKQQKEEREKTFAGSWKGRGALLNRQRSVMAARQQGEKLDLLDLQKKELEEFKARFPRRFVSFKVWLEQGQDQEAFLSFRYPNQGAIHGNSEETGKNQNAKTDLRSFTPKIGNRGGVVYSKDNSREADFIDYGKKIIMGQKCGEEAILAALQLANQKWGGAVVTGTDEYKRRCVEIAIRHNLKISNPDLARDVEEGRRLMTQLNKREVKKLEPEKLDKSDKKSLFSRYADAVGAERFRIVVTEFKENGTQAFLFDKKNGGYEGKTKEEILDAIPKFAAYSHYKKNIIVTPMSHDKHHILVDDLTADKLQQLRDDGYKPACVIESSPENYQVVITVPSVEGDSAKDRVAANKVTKELNMKYGDPKLSGSVHGHRLPPFGNFKPKHKRGDGTYPGTVLIEANGGICEKTQKQLENAYSVMKEAEKRVLREVEKEQRTPNGYSYSVFAKNPNEAYWAHYRDIMANYQGSTDYSRIDGMIAIRMRVTGYSRDQIRNAVETNAPEMRREAADEAEFNAKYRNRDWARYAVETTDNFVFGLRGLSQYESAREYRPRLFKVEGRNIRDEARRDLERNQESEQEQGR